MPRCTIQPGEQTGRTSDSDITTVSQFFVSSFDASYFKHHHRDQRRFLELTSSSVVSFWSLISQKIKFYQFNSSVHWVQVNSSGQNGYTGQGKVSCHPPVLAGSGIVARTLSLLLSFVQEDKTSSCKRTGVPYESLVFNDPRAVKPIGDQTTACMEKTRGSCTLQAPKECISSIYGICPPFMERNGC